MRTCLPIPFHESGVFHPQSVLPSVFCFIQTWLLPCSLFALCSHLNGPFPYILYHSSIWVPYWSPQLTFYLCQCFGVQSLLHTVTDAFPTELLDILRMVQEACACTCLCPWFWITTSPIIGLVGLLAVFCFEMFPSLSSRSPVQFMVKAFQACSDTHRI